MLLESVGSTIKRAEELLNRISDCLIGSEGPIRIEDHLTGDLLSHPFYEFLSFNYMIFYSYFI